MDHSNQTQFFRLQTHSQKPFFSQKKPNSQAHLSRFRVYSSANPNRSDGFSFLLCACRFKKSMWRKTTPKSLKLKKYIEGPDGTLIRDRSYVGEDARIDDPEPSQENENIKIHHRNYLTATSPKHKHKHTTIATSQPPYPYLNQTHSRMEIERNSFLVVAA